MIETTQNVSIAVGIDRVWDYVRNIEAWASIMPGYRECRIIDDNDSHWVLKVGAGGMVRTVNVLVHVDQWAGPGNVLFSYQLDGDPVQGSGTYSAVAKGANETEISLNVQVVGSGPLAPMWEAMGKPLLPQFAKSFANELRKRIEDMASGSDAGPAPVAAPAAGSAFGRWLRKIWQALFGQRDH